MVVYRHDRRRRLTLVLLVITSLALISLDERGSGLIDSARTAALALAARLRAGDLRPCPETCTRLGGCEHPGICRSLQ